MKPDIRWQLLLAAAGLGLVLALLSYQVQTAGLCSVSVPAAGGALTEGLVGAPQYLNPLLAAGNPIDRHLTNLLFDGLTHTDENGRLTPVLASTWTVSEDGRQVTFQLRDDVQWHDGRPVTTADVAFTYGLLQDSAFSGPPNLTAWWQAQNLLWSSVAITVTNQTEITFGLAEPYAPFLDATTLGILPAHRLEGVTAATLSTDAFNQFPVGTGPFQVAPDGDWRQSGRLRLLPNPTHWREGTKLDGLELAFYPNEESLLAAYQSGELHAITSVSPVGLPAVAATPATRLFTSPAPRYSQLLFNLGDTGAPAARSLAVRQALAYALNRETLVDEVLNGQALPLDGPYLPSSWAYQPGLLTPYPFQPASATALLEQEGWLTAEGSPTRQKEGQPLHLRLVLADDPTQRAVGQFIAQQWAAVGATVELLPVPPAQLRESLATRLFDVALVDVEPPGDPDLYDFWSQEAIIRGQNYGGWNHRRASEALENGRQLWNVDERRPYYQAFVRFYNDNLPALTLYQYVYTYAISERVNQVEIGRLAQPRDRYETLADWFLLYRDVTVSCES
ncbi:MAG: peptide ABC transporter substrate-binding protein [Chloroflexota bacterium]